MVEPFLARESESEAFGRVLFAMLRTTTTEDPEFLEADAQDGTVVVGIYKDYVYAWPGKVLVGGSIMRVLCIPGNDVLLFRRCFRGSNPVSTLSNSPALQQFDRPEIICPSN